MRKDRAITLGEGKRKHPRSLFRQHDRFARYSRRWFRRVPGMEGTSQALLSSGTSADPVLENGLASHCSRLSRRSARVFRALAGGRGKLRGIRAKQRDSVCSSEFHRSNGPATFVSSRTVSYCFNWLYLCRIC